MWLEYITNRKVIESVFGFEPSLTQVELFSYNLDREGAVLTLVIQLNDFPNSPPKKWSQAKSNRAQLSLRFWGVKELKADGWSSNNFVDVTIDMLENYSYSLSISGTVKLECTAKVVDVEKISHYREE